MTADLTCWTIIREAAAGNAKAREQFARLYEPVVRAYLTSRWRGGTLGDRVDDATQDVFVEMFRPDGALDKADSNHSGGFRPFLFGVTRNIALRHESQRPDPVPLLADLPADDTTLAAAFDKAWARSLLKEAARVQKERALRSDLAAVRRVELLRLRFHEGLPIREIAKQWNEEPAKLHHEYATARHEFRAALQEVVAFHHPSATSDIDRACVELLGLLG